MNYLRELNAFRDYALLNPLATGEVALWHSLMSVNNQASWREWFTAPNLTLQTLTGLSRQGLDKARNRLVQRELIEYTKGRSNQAGFYKIYSVCQIVVTAVDTVVVTAVDTVGVKQLSQQERHSGTYLDLNKNIAVADANHAPASEGNAVPIQPRDDYLDIEALVVPLLGRPMLTPDEIHMLDDLFKSGVSKETILLGITKAFETYKPKNSRDKISRLTYCRNHILDLHDIATYEPQEIATGKIREDRARNNQHSRVSPSVQRVAPAVQAGKYDEFYRRFSERGIDLQGGGKPDG